MPSILLNKTDYQRLKDLVAEFESGAISNSRLECILTFKKRLSKARVLEPGDIDLIDVVTINSAVKFKNLSTREEKEYLIVYPKLECKNLGRISILSEIGVALLGHKKWEVVRVKKSNGEHYSVQILDVQPTSLEWIKRLEEQC
jgi:regulator of nucleoside diphosphate kinase